MTYNLISKINIQKLLLVLYEFSVCQAIIFYCLFTNQASRQNRSDLAEHYRLEDNISPFKLPGDDDIMMYAQIEKQRKSDLQNQTSSNKIWEKFTASTRQPLKHYKDFQAEINDRHQPKISYNNDQKTRLIEAQRIIKERQKRKNEGSFRRESAVEVKEQKKEMFLVSMAHGIIQKEDLYHMKINKIQQTPFQLNSKIERLITKTQEKDQALIQSEKQLKQDHENFTKFLEQNKQQKQDAEYKADAVMKEKKQKEADYKQLTHKLQTLKSEKLRMEEQLQTYKEHKEFLDKITPKEWNETKEKRIKEIIEQVRKDFVNNRLNELEREKKIENKKNNKGQKVTITEKERIQIEEQFNTILQSGEIEKLEYYMEDELKIIN